MNCANHSNAAAIAYCRTCGKPLCATCIRDVRGVIYCESCLADRLGVTQPADAPPAAGFVPPAARPTGGTSSGPNPALAGVLSGIFPFGVGAVYCGQYAKGLAHLGIFVLLIVMVSSNVPWYLHMLFGIGIAFFVVYQIADAVRTAQALQTGQPAPDPFGLAQAFGTGEKFDSGKVPTGAVVLIVLGLLFLLNTTGIFEVSFDRIWPLFLIALGVWLLIKRWGVGCSSSVGCTCARCRTRGVMGPAVLITIGGLFLLDSFGHEWGHTWPILLIVIGVVKFLQGNASLAGHVEVAPAPGTGPAVRPPAPQQPPSNEVDHV